MHGLQMSSLPFQHALACIMHKHVDLINYIDTSLTKATYLLAYIEAIHLIPNATNQPKVDKSKTLPSTIYIRCGRPKVNKMKEPGKVPLTITKTQFTINYNICNVLSHNKKKCPKDLVSAFIYNFKKIYKTQF